MQNIVRKLLELVKWPQTTISMKNKEKTKNEQSNAENQVNCDNF